MTASSAVWVLVDTYDGSIIADEVVPLESVNEIARAAARSVQAFALQSEQDIDGVRLVWDDEGRQHGIRLRTKLRLFGFDTVETVSEDAAREGRNRTARHIAPHMVLAYGAARADLDDADGKGVLGRLAARVPHDRSGGMPTGGGGRIAALRSASSEAALRISDRVRHVGSSVSRPVAASAAGVALVAAVSGVVGWALLSGPSSAPETPETASVAAVVPVPAAPALPAVPQAVVAPIPAPEAIVEPEVTVAEALPEVEELPEYTAAVPQTAAETETEVATTPLLPAEVATGVPTVQGLGSTAQNQTGVPHLTGVGPQAGPPLPVTSAASPASSASSSVPSATGYVPVSPISGQATPGNVPAQAAPAPAGPIGSVLSALP
ncbi:hypothetical protein [Mycobacterium sp. 236(2023)]|uniref:hypothetical protein n=1 Tax=Mycobacterium sp. 236(2023) TaxID=3038163 RepID=UPI002414DFF7|nr:hypothetical protein [Mycobacterium sp. 236(2023)]MDG4666978.1 hypothetical protein [Mycobacterium sp. 236(2023)]